MKQIIRLAFLAVLFVFGCSNKTEEKAAGTSNLIIYTTRDKDEVAAVVDLFTQKFPTYKGKVDTVILGAQTALDRLRAEKANPQAGFLWGGTLQGLQQAANEGLLVSSNPTNANLIDASRKDPQGRWFAEILYPEVIVYNHDLLKPDQAPKSYADLLDPKWKGMIVKAHPSYSGTILTSTYQIATTLVEEGDYAQALPRLEKLVAASDDKYRQSSLRMDIADLKAVHRRCHPRGKLSL